MLQRPKTLNLSVGAVVRFVQAFSSVTHLIPLDRSWPHCRSYCIYQPRASGCCRTGTYSSSIKGRKHLYFCSRKLWMAPESFPGHAEVDTLCSNRLANGAPVPGRREFSDGLAALVIVVNHNRLSEWPHNCVGLRKQVLNPAFVKSCVIWLWISTLWFYFSLYKGELVTVAPPRYPEGLCENPEVMAMDGLIKHQGRMSTFQSSWNHSTCGLWNWQPGFECQQCHLLGLWQLLIPFVSRFPHWEY